MWLCVEWYFCFFCCYCCCLFFLTINNKVVLQFRACAASICIASECKNNVSEFDLMLVTLIALLLLPKHSYQMRKLNFHHLLCLFSKLSFFETNKKMYFILKCICSHYFVKLFNSRLRNHMLFREEELSLPYLL